MRREVDMILTEIQQGYLLKCSKVGYRIVCVPDGATNNGRTATVSHLTKSRSLFCLAFRPSANRLLSAITSPNHLCILPVEVEPKFCGRFIHIVYHAYYDYKVGYDHHKLAAGPVANGEM